MERTTLFIGLTREVTVAGLPLMYVVILIGVSLIGFILSSSFTYFLTSGVGGYLLMRTLAAYDPKMIDVLLATMQCTHMEPGVFTKAGVTYRA
jgi:type IV secretory pathway VirB3-like protein